MGMILAVVFVVASAVGILVWAFWPPRKVPVAPYLLSRSVVRKNAEGLSLGEAVILGNGVELGIRPRTPEEFDRLIEQRRAEFVADPSLPFGLQGAMINHFNSASETPTVVRHEPINHAPSHDYSQDVCSPSDSGSNSGSDGGSSGGSFD